ncbi:hypothetical protein PCYB_123900 [Plasmodium cynomolgi strain B]|uniref:Vacuolar protein sorting-associated protein 52 n=1 Tax=Plasmodium cynomolgi (strain B) TaxID=1120755 RepID=K6UW30_PLACD|nr:hypothetical protein PCYB_123900 [Plasmodium cynomolgi strain B]GAB67824.1 hypothetical protein PCYB_123900 [Plasmodium cynomolgi strain B]
MQYERVQALVKQFQEDKYVLRAYGKIYALNRCKAYRSVRVEDVERRRQAAGEGSPGGGGEGSPNDGGEEEHPAKGSGEKPAKGRGEHPAKGSGEHPAKGSGEHPAKGSGEHPAQLDGIIQIVNKTLYHYTNETLSQFSENDAQLAQVYSQIDHCSTLCQEVDTVLTNHKNEITYISSDINEIQTITETMTHKLHNRKLTQELLNTYIKIIIVTPQLICDICNGPINEQFIENVKILTKKMENCEHCLFDSYPSIRSSYVELVKLKNKAIDRIHRFFRNSIYDIECKRSNVHFVQQHLAKFHKLNWFLYNNSKDAYTYLVKEYVAIMNRTYYNLFRSYMQELEKKKVEFTEELTIGWSSGHVDLASGGSDFRTGRSEPLSDPSNWHTNRANSSNTYGEGTNSQNDSLVPGINANLSLLSAKNKMMNILGFGSKGGGGSQERKESLFPLSNRTSVLLDLAYYPGKGSHREEPSTGGAPTGEAPTGGAPTAEAPTASTLPIIFTTDSRPHFFESIYKSINKLFIDTGTAEYLFLSNFFRNHENHDFLFLYVYAKTLSLHFDFLYYYLSETYDFIALFCIYIINMNNGCLTKRRGIAPLYEFMNRIQNLVWNRIDYIVSENVKSVTVNRVEMSRLEMSRLEMNRLEMSRLEMSEQRSSHNPNPVKHNPVTHSHQKNSLYDLFHLNSAQTGSAYLSSASVNASIGYALHGVVKKFSDFYCSLVVLTKLSLHFEKQHHVRMCCGVASSGEGGTPHKKKATPTTTLDAHPGEELPSRGEELPSKGEPLPANHDREKRTKSNDTANGSDHSAGDELQNVKPKIKEKSQNDETDNQVGLTDGEGELPRKECKEGKQGDDEDTERKLKESQKKDQQMKEDHPIEEKYNHLNDLIGRLEENIIDVLAVHKNQFTNTRDQLLFLINNYCHMIDVMKRNTIDEEKIDRFDELLKKEIHAYVEYQLNHYATDLILFVCKHEQIVDKLKKDGYHPSDFTSEVDVKLMESVAIQFTKKWKNLFKNIKQEVTLSFTHTDTSAQILKMLNTQILLYFTRFHQLLKGFFAHVQPPPYVENLPSVDVVLVQIKKDAKGG